MHPLLQIQSNSVLSILYLVIFWGHFTAHAQQPTQVCTTKGCNFTATRLTNSINWTASPCDDFYEYTCGGFINKTTLLDSETQVSQFTLIAKQIDKDLLFMVNTSVTTSDTLPERLMKTFFQSCMNMTRINELGTKAMRDMMDYIGGWPVISPNWKNTTFNWLKTALRCREKGLTTNALLSLYIDRDDRNSSVNIIHVDSLGLWSNREIILRGLSDANNKAHLDLMINVSVILGANRSDAQVELTEAYQLMIELVNNTLTSEQIKNRSLIYNKMTIKQLASNFSNIPWLQYINGMLLNEYNVTENDYVIVTEMHYMEYLNERISTISNRTIANYAVWKAVFKILQYMNQDILMAKLAYDKIVSGVEDFQPRNIFCIETAKKDSVLKLAVGAQYAKTFYVNGTKEAVRKIVNNLKSVFNETLTNVSWMDNVTRAAAKVKLEKMKLVVGYPDQMLNETIIDEEFKGLNFNETQLLENILKVKILQTIKSIQTLKMPAGEDLWKTFSDSTIVNAYYMNLINYIFFPLGALQGAIFGIDYPQFINYGALGFLGGHELTHGFDDQNSQFDGDGNIVNWWHEGTRERFKNMSQCFIDQYTFRIPELNITTNGRQTLSENIADNGGIKQAYKAYQNETRENPYYSLNGFQNFTSSQMFWLGYASLLCNVMRPEYRKTRIQERPHTDPKYRINLIAQNTPQFKQDWNCPVGSPMAPNKTCAIW